MAEIKITQQMIDYYRSKTGNAVLLDSAIIDLIEKDIETGKLPKQFATLASDAQKTGYNAASSNLFGYGFDTDSNIGLTFERITNFSSESTEKKDSTQAQISPEDFVRGLGLNIESGEGSKIYSKLSNVVIDIEPADIKSVLTENSLEPTFDNVSNIMELLYGVSLRNEEEFKASEGQRNKIITQIQAANIMEHFFSLSAQWNDQYTDSLGLFGLGSEGIGYVINKLGLDGKNHFQWADSCREWAERAGKLSVLNPEKFQEEFKKVYSVDGKYGIEFNEENFNNLLNLVKEEKIFDKDGKLTQEGKEAVLKAFNFVLNNPNESTDTQVMNGFGEALIMIATLGWGATTKGGQMLATSSMATFSKAGVAIASKSVNSKLLQGALRFTGKGVKLLGPAVNEGTKMALYTMTTGTAANATNRIVNADSEENSWKKFLQTEAMVMEGAKGSFAFGAFAGVFGSTVTQAVVQRVSKVSSKVTTALTDKFAIGAVDANEVFSTYLAKSIPVGALEKATVELAAFATDVVGFTAFETAIALFEQVKNLPENEQPQKFTEILWGHFKDQGYNLGQIKIVSHLVMWMSGSRGARMASTNYLKENLPQLKDATVEMIKNNRFKINLKDGRSIECKNGIEMLSSLNLMVRGETALVKNFNNSNDENVIRKNLIKEFKNELGSTYKQLSNFLENLSIYELELIKNIHKKRGDGDFISTVKDIQKIMPSFSKEIPNIFKALSKLSEGNVSQEIIHDFIYKLKESESKINDISLKDFSSLLKLQKENVEPDVIFDYLNLKIENNSISDVEILKNYSNRYSKIAERLDEFTFSAFMQEIYILLKNIESSGEAFTINDLKTSIKNIEINLNDFFISKNKYFAECDKKQFSILKDLIQNEPLQANEKISEYFLRIVSKNDFKYENMYEIKFEENKNKIESSYVEEQPMADIELTPEERALYESKKDIMIRGAGNPNAKQGEGGRIYNSKQKILAQALRDGYPRYNSTEYFKANPDRIPFGRSGDYKYIPLIRFWEFDKSGYHSIPELIEKAFPEKGGVYQANSYKCCFTTPIGSKDIFASDIIIEIHPKSETSMGFFVKGWDSEVRYGGDQKFKVIDKGYFVQERFSDNDKLKREIQGFVILQEY